MHYDHHFSRRFRPLLHPAIINISQAIDDDDHEAFQDGQAKRPSIHARTLESAFIAECHADSALMRILGNNSNALSLIRDVVDGWSTPSSPLGIAFPFPLSKGVPMAGVIVVSFMSFFHLEDTQNKLLYFIVL